MNGEIDVTLCPDTEALRSFIAEMEPADREAILVARCMRLELKLALLERVLEVVQMDNGKLVSLARRTLETVRREDL